MKKPLAAIEISSLYFSCHGEALNSGRKDCIITSLLQQKMKTVQYILGENIPGVYHTLETGGL